MFWQTTSRSERPGNDDIGDKSNSLFRASLPPRSCLESLSWLCAVCRRLIAPSGGGDIGPPSSGHGVHVTDTAPPAPSQECCLGLALSVWLPGSGWLSSRGMARGGPNAILLPRRPLDFNAHRRPGLPPPCPGLPPPPRPVLPPPPRPPPAAASGRAQGRLHPRERRLSHGGLGPNVKEKRTVPPAARRLETGNGAYVSRGLSTRGG